MIEERGAAVWLATRDLRVHDNPALAAAVAAGGGRVVPLFVIDPAIPKPANRAAFLAASLADLDASLRRRGSALVVRHGDPAVEAVRVAAAAGICPIAAMSPSLIAMSAR